MDLESTIRIGHALEYPEKHQNLETSPISSFLTTHVSQKKSDDVVLKVKFANSVSCGFSLPFYFQVAKLGSLPNNIMDIWEFLGKPQHCRYTWDTYSNTNLNAEYKCKLRFDRIYFRPAADGGHIIPRSMDLIGLEKLDCGRFPSDHWGLLCKFDVIL